MPSSKKKFILRVVLTICICAGVLFFLDLALYPCTFIRNDVHAITQSRVDDLYLGTSHGKINIDPAVIKEETGRSGYNMANGNEYPIDSYYLTKLLVELGKAPGRVIYVTTPEYFTMEKEEGHNYLLFYHEFPVTMTKLEYFFASVAKCNLRTGLFPWYEYPLSTELKTAGNTLKKKLTGDYSPDAFKSETQEYHTDGHIARKPVDPSTFSFPDYVAFDPKDVVEENLEWIRKLAALCSENGITFIAVTAPTALPVLERYGEGFSRADRFFTDFYGELGVPYFNFNAGEYYGSFTHSVTAFTDLDGHMHQEAAADFSRVLAQTLEDTV